MESLRKREDATTPCNSTLTNNDQMYRLPLMKKVGCIPIYWTHLVSGEITKTINLPKCNRTKDYKALKQYLPDIGDVKVGTGLYTQPCAEMTITLTMAQSDYEGSGELGFQIYYDTEQYKIIENSRGFGLQDLWSQIGGFIGIFLGYSLLQMPELLSSLVTWIQSIMKEKQRRANERSLTNQQNTDASHNNNPLSTQIEMTPNIQDANTQIKVSKLDIMKILINIMKF